MYKTHIINSYIKGTYHFSNEPILIMVNQPISFYRDILDKNKVLAGMHSLI